MIESDAAISKERPHHLYICTHLWIYIFYSLMNMLYTIAIVMPSINVKSKVQERAGFLNVSPSCSICSPTVNAG